MRRTVALLVLGWIGAPAVAQTVDPVDFCVEWTNRYRAAAKKPPFKRTALLDAYARDGAAEDAKRRSPHHHFNTTKLPDTFTRLAENELPWWHVDPDRDGPRRAIQAGLASMWAEGPGGGHYENLVGPYEEMGCGITIQGDELTLVQDFRAP